MRKRYIVSYDIREPKRLRMVFNKMRGFGNPLQYSMFLCELSDKEKAILVSDLTEIISMTEDSVVIVDLGSAEANLRRKISMIGQTKEVEERNSIIF
ncbi:MAG: CRISPR-associated endonuclease Cas2 [Thermoplasmatales archaeon]